MRWQTIESTVCDWLQVIVVGVFVGLVSSAVVLSLAVISVAIFLLLGWPL